MNELFRRPRAVTLVALLALAACSDAPGAQPAADAGAARGTASAPAPGALPELVYYKISDS